MENYSYLKDYIKAVEKILDGQYVMGLDCIKLLDKTLIEATKGKKISRGLELLFVATDVENRVLDGEDAEELYRQKIVGGENYPEIRDRCRGFLNEFVQRMKHRNLI